MRLLSQRFRNGARNKWLLRLHVRRIWLMRLFLITDVSSTHQITSPRRPPGEPCGNDLLHDWAISPYPLTPVLVEKTSAVLRKAGYRSAYLYTCAAGDVPISEPTLLALQDVLQIVNDFLRFCTE